MAIQSVARAPQSSSPTFCGLGLCPSLVRAVAQSGYTTPTPIQEQAIPRALAGADLLASAQTGTGKTAAFALPLLQHVDRVASDECIERALVLTPTRELALQIATHLKSLGKYLELEHAVLIGGVNIKTQKRLLSEGVDIVVSTPGRLLDLLRQRALDLGHVDFLVLDEADRMLDMGFRPDIERIIRQIPKQRQTLLFSATLSREVETLARGLQKAPERIRLEPTLRATDNVEQSLYFVEKGDKRSLLLRMLRSTTTGRTLVFSRTKHGANRITKSLQAAGIRAAAIHGNKSQNARAAALDSFRSERLDVLVATDVVARGIDIHGIERVINVDLPRDAETYVHRVGRTGRAGATGIAVSFCEPSEQPTLRLIEKSTGTTIRRANAPSSQTDGSRADSERSDSSGPPAKRRRSRRPRRRPVS